MSNQPRVSVLMPARNAARFLPETINSVLQQTLESWEMVAVDDGSTDETPTLLASAAKADPRIRVLHTKGVGLTPCLNISLRHARAPYVARLDADDVCHPTRLARQVEALDQRSELGVVAGKVRYIGGDGTLVGESTPIDSPGTMRTALASFCAITHSAATFRRDLVLSIGGYREALRVAQDYDLWLRVSEHAEIIDLLDVVLDYRVHSAQVSHVQLEEQALGWMLARAAARMRARTGVDPVVSGPIDRTLLASLGVSGRAMRRDRITFLTRAGLNAAARGQEPLARFVASTIRSEAWHAAAGCAAHRAWIRARWCAQRGDHLAAGLSVAMACMLRPAYVVSLVRRLWRDRRGAYQ